MSKMDDYRKLLQNCPDWDEVLLRESGLPGPRGNLELAAVVAQMGDYALFDRYLSYTPEAAPTNSPQEFLHFCGALGLGEYLAKGETRHLTRLRLLAQDPRWRTREAVAMALQRWGDADIQALLDEMDSWSQGNPYEQRAAVAGLCEPRLLGDPAVSRRVLSILDRITGSLAAQPDRKDPAASAAVEALKKGLGYGWSVAIAANPEAGKPLFEKWLEHPDRNVAWVVRENLKKNRLLRMDPAWVNGLLQTMKS